MRALSCRDNSRHFLARNFVQAQDVIFVSDRSKLATAVVNIARRYPERSNCWHIHWVRSPFALASRSIPIRDQTKRSALGTSNVWAGIRASAHKSWNWRRLNEVKMITITQHNALSPLTHAMVASPKLEAE
jgi:hypothetical protein